MKKSVKFITLIISIVALITVFTVGFTACDFFGLGSSGSKKEEEKAPTTVKVTLNANGGTGLSQTTLIGKPGDPMTLQSPTRSGFTFDKWYSGYQLIDNTVFPKRDTVLTARYYCNEEYTDFTSAATALNKVYSGSGGYFYFPRADFDEEKIDYLFNNITTKISIVVELEAFCNASGAAQWMGTEASMTLTGANRNDKFSKITIKNYETYQNYTLKADTTADKITTSNPNEGIINLRYDTTLGSTDCAWRNVTVTITYQVAAGSLV